MTGRRVDRTGQRICDSQRRDSVIALYIQCHRASGLRRNHQQHARSHASGMFGMAEVLCIPGGDLVEDHSCGPSAQPKPRPTAVDQTESEVEYHLGTTEQTLYSTWKCVASKSYRASVHRVSATPTTTMWACGRCQRISAERQSLDHVRFVGSTTGAKT